MMEKRFALKITCCGMIVGLQRIGDAPKCKIMCDGNPAIRGIPRNGTGPEYLPSERQRAKRLETHAEPTQRNQTQRAAAEG